MTCTVGVCTLYLSHTTRASGVLLGTTRPSSALKMSTSTNTDVTMSVSGNDGSDSSITNRKSGISNDDVSEESVHLKLQEIKSVGDNNSEERSTSNNQPTSNDAEGKESGEHDQKQQHMLLIREYTLVNDTSSILLAALGGVDAFQLELYSIHVFGRNYSEVEGVMLREVTIDPRNSSLLDSYVNMWKAERLIANTKDFPQDITKGEKVTKFTGPIIGHVRRMKRLRMERLTTDALLESFLQKHSIIEQFRRDEQRDNNETLFSLKAFATWFRVEFPYYYQSCLHCGHKDDNVYYGMVYPSADEQEHEAGRTELYICSNATCSKTSRFPRYNAVCKVLETRRGRCGEYSILMMRMLELLGYDAKWVVDWADHVWCEVLVGDRWVHVDPCEASVNEPLIYEGWGKNQTYILSYSNTDVEDVTAKYTTRYEESLSRREKDDDVNSTFVEERLELVRRELRKESSLHQQ